MSAGRGLSEEEVESDSGFCLSKIYSKLLSCLTCRLFVKNGTANLYQDWVLDRGLGKILVNEDQKKVRPHWFHCVPIGLSIPLVYLLGVLPTSVQPARASVDRGCETKLLEPRLQLRGDSIPATVYRRPTISRRDTCDRWGAGPAPTPLRR